MSARYYEPTLHRWISRDPLDIAGGINLYTFNRNNPVNYVDPDGQLAFLPVLAAVIVVDFIYDRFFKDDVDRFVDCYVPAEYQNSVANVRQAVDIVRTVRNPAKMLGAAYKKLKKKGPESTQGMTGASRKRFKRTVNNLSQPESSGLSQQKLNQLRRIANKADGKVRVDLDGVRGSGVRPHAHVEGMGSKVESRHIWLKEGVK